jgi:hypothetical protein
MLNNEYTCRWSSARQSLHLAYGVRHESHVSIAPRVARFDTLQGALRGVSRSDAAGSWQ